MIGTDCDADVCYLSDADLAGRRDRGVLPARAGDAGPRLAHRADVRRRLQGAAPARRRPHLLRRRVRGVLRRRHLLPARQPQRAAAAGRGRCRPRRSSLEGVELPGAGRPRGDAGVRLRAGLAGAGPVVPLHRPAGGRPPSRRLAARLPRRAAGLEPSSTAARGPATCRAGASGVRPLGAPPESSRATPSPTSAAGSAATRRSSPGTATRCSPTTSRRTPAGRTGKRLRAGRARRVRRTPADARRAAHRAVTGAEIALAGRGGTSTRAGWSAASATRPGATCGGWPARRCAGSDGSLFLEFAASRPGRRARRPTGLVRRLDAGRRGPRDRGVRRPRRRPRGGPGEDLFGHPDPWTCRLQVTFPTVRAAGMP